MALGGAHAFTARAIACLARLSGSAFASLHRSQFSTTLSDGCDFAVNATSR
jgi:hypothetical protein